MIQAVMKEKILSLEAELNWLKEALTRRPDFDIDLKNWRKIKQEAKKIRKQLYSRHYGQK